MVTLEKIEAVPTNIITGALGVGKTTQILKLLEEKPDSERWAVLVNEFGEIGIDGSLMETEHKGVYIREVPGGCMCCTSGLPMHIALNQLLAEARPDRLLIEPTGLGHPVEVLQTLNEPHYQDVLDVRATLTLIDARKLESEKWRNHPTFREQLSIADVIVSTKSDLYESHHFPLLTQHLAELNLAKTHRADAVKDSIDFALLDRPQLSLFEHSHSHVHSHASSHEHDKKETIAEQQVYKVANHGQGFFSYGWICSATRVFELATVESTLRRFTGERLKAIMQTEKGPIAFNVSEGHLDMADHSYRQDSRMEFICDTKQGADDMAELLESALALQAEYG